MLDDTRPCLICSAATDSPYYYCDEHRAALGKAFKDASPLLLQRLKATRGEELDRLLDDPFPRAVFEIANPELPARRMAEVFATDEQDPWGVDMQLALYPKPMGSQRVKRNRWEGKWYIRLADEWPHGLDADPRIVEHLIPYLSKAIQEAVASLPQAWAQKDLAETLREGCDCNGTDDACASRAAEFVCGLTQDKDIRALAYLMADLGDHIIDSDFDEPDYCWLAHKDLLPSWAQDAMKKFEEYRDRNKEEFE